MYCIYVILVISLQHSFFEHLFNLCYYSDYLGLPAQDSVVGKQMPVCHLNRFFTTRYIHTQAGHFVMVPFNLTYLHRLQHSFFEHLFNLYWYSLITLIIKTKLRPSRIWKGKMFVCLVGHLHANQLVRLFVIGFSCLIHGLFHDHYKYYK